MTNFCLKTTISFLLLYSTAFWICLLHQDKDNSGYLCLLLLLSFMTTLKAFYECSSRTGINTTLPYCHRKVKNNRDLYLQSRQSMSESMLNSEHLGRSRRVYLLKRRPWTPLWLLLMEAFFMRPVAFRRVASRRVFSNMVFLTYSASCINTWTKYRHNQADFVTSKIEHRRK